MAPAQSGFTEETYYFLAPRWCLLPVFSRRAGWGRGALIPSQGCPLRPKPLPKARLLTPHYPAVGLRHGNSAGDPDIQTIARLKGRQAFSGKDQTVNISGSVGQPVSVTIPRLWSPCTKAATDNVSTDGRGSVPIKLYLQQHAAGQMGPRALVCQPLL